MQQTVGVVEDVVLAHLVTKRRSVLTVEGIGDVVDLTVTPLINISHSAQTELPVLWIDILVSPASEELSGVENVEVGQRIDHVRREFEVRCGTRDNDPNIPMVWRGKHRGESRAFMV